MTTNQKELVSDEELDQMIWKLERDGMTPKMLSLMRELRELRMAKGDGRDQFEEWFKFHHGEEGSIVTLHRANGGANYADPHVDLAWIAWKDSRTAMLNHSGDTADMAEPVSNRDELPATQFKPVADLYGITSPTGSETSFTFDAIEAANFIEGGWSVQEYVELERYQESMIGNSPATPDGWISVSERMPERGEDVLAYRPDAPESNDPLIKMSVYVGKSAHGHGFDCYCKPSHWMPLPAAPNFREISNSSTNNCREITETSTNCHKCGGRGTYHCPQMLGTVECECTLPAAPKEVG